MEIEHSSVFPSEKSYQGQTGVSDTPAGIELPRGGGAIQGISEKFATNPVTGTSSLSIPMPVASGRGLEPSLSLAYDSGSGNGPFGFGWHLDLPQITRKTEKGLPEYKDEIDSDVYMLRGLEDLVPSLQEDNGDWQEQQPASQIELAGAVWDVKLYRPRIESSFAKIERWREARSNRIWWRMVSSDNLTSVFGFNESAQVAAPGDPSRVFSWLLDFVYDDKGNVTRYSYIRENLAGVDPHQLHESHRVGQAQAECYLKKVCYGIKQSRLAQGIDEQALFTHDFTDRDFLFQTVFDYGDHALGDPNPEPDTWPVRPDPVSSFRSGFEIRTYRRCQRVMLFHDFTQLGPEPELIRAVEFGYESSQAEFSFLTSITQTGYLRTDANQFSAKSMPPLEFDYAQPNWNTTAQSLSESSLDGMSAGVQAPRMQWLDLYGEGLKGVLSQEAGALRFKRNLGEGQWGPSIPLGAAPNVKDFGTTWQLADLEANGQRALVTSEILSGGFFSINAEGDWEPFRAFEDKPRLTESDPNVRAIDLSGDGRPDLLVTEERVFRWYPSKGTKGYDLARETPAPTGSRDGPEVVFESEAERIFTADMTGDGLSDIVRIRNGSVDYWPNMGYGRFGHRIAMSNAPTLDHPDHFSVRNVKLVDLDGSGVSDLVYLGKSEFRIWLNGSGNKWVEAPAIANPFPELNNQANVSFLDLLGTGTTCIVWSSVLPAQANQSVRYIDLMSSVKPYLLKKYSNGFGRTISLEYTASTKFYLEDEQRGEPWVTKLHFPVHCLSRVETHDAVTGSRFVSSYTYHHGYYDHAEREFRGFGRVEHTSSESYQHFAKSGGTNVVEKVLHQTPVLVKTWFHTGAYLDQERILTHFEGEYFQHANVDKFRVPPTQLPTDLSVAEWREAVRACKGMRIRRETYGLDESSQQSIPYSVEISASRVRSIQPKRHLRHAVFQVLPTQTLNVDLDRNPQDPRVSHQLVLSTNEYGQALQTASIAYPRKQVGPVQVADKQAATHCVLSQATFTEDAFGLLGDHNLVPFQSVLRAPVVWRQQTFELALEWRWTDAIFSMEQVVALYDQASLVDYSQAGVAASEKRLLSAVEHYFVNASLDGELQAGQFNALGLGWKSYQLAFTPDQLSSVYAGRVETTTPEGGYVDLHDDGCWWVPSGTAIFHNPDSTESADHRFFQPFGQEDALGAASWIDLDEYLLLPTASSISMVGYAQGAPHRIPHRINETIACNDYRTLQPKYQRDANHNWSGVATDELGLVIRTAAMGKVEGASPQQPPTDEAVCEGDNLAHPSTELAYTFYDPDTQHPAWVVTNQYTEHYWANQARTDSLVQYEYSDGAGNVVMVKAQTTPGLAKQLQADGSVVEVDTGSAPRWIGNGRTIINNAGQPVKQYEPYFSVSPAYENAAALVETGVSPILFYDAAGRNICTLNPDQTFLKVQFDAWSNLAWDANDTLLVDGQTSLQEDPDVGHLFAQLDVAEHSPGWYAARINGDMGPVEQRAAEVSRAHAATPNEIHSDGLGRTIYSIANNGDDGAYHTTTQFDVEGNVLEILDPRDNAVMQYKYSMLPASGEDSSKPPVYQNSSDGGESWILFDIQGKTIKSWDSRSHLVENEFDGLHRPTKAWVSDAESRLCVGFTTYADSYLPDAQALRLHNLLGQAVEVYDQSGRSQTISLDFKGNVLLSKRTLAKEYRESVDWSEHPETQLEEEVFSSASQYDALNRIVFAQAPHHSSMPMSTTRPQYNESGGLDKLWVNVREQGETLYVDRIEYNPKGQRISIRYGNGVVTTYEYDDLTYRLRKLVTASAQGQRLQELNYFYDPIGNITDVRDDAQQTVFFDNRIVQAHRAYEYDALYRLVSASGREHAQQAQFAHFQNGYLPLEPGHDAALINYSQTYSYDSVGNLTQMAHRRSNAAGDGWTRHYQFAASSNRLLGTTLGDPVTGSAETYTYNAAGSMTNMPRFADAGSNDNMHWDFNERLQRLDLGGGGTAYYVYDASGQRIRKVVESNGALVKDRIYLGGWEIYRERNASGVSLERETLHVVDDQSRIALIETKTVGEPGQEGLDSVVRYQLGDHLGSASMELSETGELISYEEFHPYGTTAYHAGTSMVTTSLKRYRFTGKERDEESGFSYHGARYLCPTLGRWVSSDPAGIADGMNLYAYTRGNPISYSDPSGMGSETPLFDAVLGIQESDRLFHIDHEIAKNGMPGGITDTDAGNLSFLPASANTSKSDKSILIGANPGKAQVSIADHYDDPAKLKQIGTEIFTGRRFSEVAELDALWNQAKKDALAANGGTTYSEVSPHFRRLLGGSSEEAIRLQRVFAAVGVDVNPSANGTEIKMRSDSVLLRSGSLARYLNTIGFMEKTRRIESASKLWKDPNKLGKKIGVIAALLAFASAASASEEAYQTGSLDPIKRELRKSADGTVVGEIYYAVFEGKNLASAGLSVGIAYGSGRVVGFLITNPATASAGMAAAPYYVTVKGAEAQLNHMKGVLEKHGATFPEKMPYLTRDGMIHPSDPRWKLPEDRKYLQGLRSAN